MLTVAVEAWMGHAAGVLRGTWCGVPQRAKHSG